MKKALLALLVPMLALAGTVSKTIAFDSRDLVMTEANGYDVVRLADFTTMNEPGKPMLPEAVFNVLVPATATVTAVEVTPLNPENIPGTWKVHPGQPPVILSATELPEFIEPDPATYSSSSPYPAELVDHVPTGTKSGYRLCGFALRPMTWIPTTGKLTLYRRMEVRVTYEEGTITPGTLTSNQRAVFERDVRGLIINGDDVTRFAPAVRLTDDLETNYVIVTSDALSGNWDDLVEWRTKKGHRAGVFTTSWIGSNYTGRDTQEKIRNFIIDYFENHGLIFVLLAGDNHIVPGRRCRAVVNTTTGNIPADVYYADLQWSYDGNRNNVFGEANYDTVDFYYDVYVGRASVDNATQCNTFVNKVLFYEKTPTTDYLKKLCLPYTQLWSNYSGKVISDSIAAQSPAGWTDFYVANPTNTSPMRNAINAGYHFTHATAHGSATSLADMQGRTIYNTSVAGGQTNSTRPTILNSIACISGNFEHSDCIAEALMNNANGGAVAVIMNSRYGWGTPPSMGPSEKIDNKFYDWYFRRDSIEIGVTHARSKDFYAYSAQAQGVWRWCYWGLNLFGDPNMPMWKTDPVTLSADQPDTVETGAQNLDVIVTTGGNRVAGALVCCWKGDELHVSGHTNWNGEVTLAVNPLTTGMMYFTATAKSAYPLEDSIVVTQGAPQPYVRYQSHYVDDSGNNQLDPGETADLLVTLKNAGNAGATNVNAVLRTESGYITFTDSTSSCGTIGAGDTVRGDAFTLTAAGGTPPGTRIGFTIHVTSNEGTWDPTFELIVGTAATPGAVVMDHDTGYCKLTVTALGGIGFTEPPADLGAGFSYPKASASQLYYASFMLGNSPSYLCDRFYSQPANSGVNTDFEIVDSLRAVIPPGSGDEHFRCVIDDGGHPSSKDLTITQHSHMCADAGYDDFVVLAYDITNDGGTAVNGLHAGIISDFDIGTSNTNTAASNEAKRYSYMRQSSSANPCVGLKILEPASFANLTAVDHERYVYPDSCVTDGIKYRILDGTISMRSSNRSYDWSVAVSVGPFDLAAGERKRVAFAVIGGNSESNFEANADSAQSWYDINSSVFEPQQPRLRDRTRIECVPNPFTRSVKVSCQVPVAGRVRLQVFDVSGRTVAVLVDENRMPGRLETVWQPGELANGVYLLKMTLAGDAVTEKLMLLR